MDLQTGQLMIPEDLRKQDGERQPSLSSDSGAQRQGWRAWEGRASPSNRSPSSLLCPLPPSPSVEAQGSLGLRTDATAQDFTDGETEVRRGVRPQITEGSDAPVACAHSLHVVGPSGVGSRVGSGQTHPTPMPAHCFSILNLFPPPLPTLLPPTTCISSCPTNTTNTAELQGSIQTPSPSCPSP